MKDIFETRDSEPSDIGPKVANLPVSVSQEETRDSEPSVNLRKVSQEEAAEPIKKPSMVTIPVTRSKAPSNDVAGDEADEAQLCAWDIELEEVAQQWTTLIMHVCQHWDELHPRHTGRLVALLRERLLGSGA